MRDFLGEAVARGDICFSPTSSLGRSKPQPDVDMLADELANTNLSKINPKKRISNLKPRQEQTARVTKNHKATPTVASSATPSQATKETKTSAGKPRPRQKAPVWRYPSYVRNYLPRDRALQAEIHAIMSRKKKQKDEMATAFDNLSIDKGKTQTGKPDKPVVENYVM